LDNPIYYKSKIPLKYKVLQGGKDIYKKLLLYVNNMLILYINKRYTNKMCNEKLVHTIKYIVVLSCLFVFYQIKIVQAFGNGPNGENLTEIALQSEQEAMHTGNPIQYESPMDLVYRRTLNVGERVTHIYQHLADDEEREIHTYFDEYMEVLEPVIVSDLPNPVYYDVIGFIDMLFSAFEQCNVDVSNDQNSGSRNIDLHSKRYNVSVARRTNGNFVCTILPDPAATGVPDIHYFPYIGNDGGVQGRTVEPIRRLGYEIIYRIEQDRYNIYSFYPC
jgi:hypothetical protein